MQLLHTQMCIFPNIWGCARPPTDGAIGARKTLMSEGESLRGASGCTVRPCISPLTFDLSEQKGVPQDLFIPLRWSKELCGDEEGGAVWDTLSDEEHSSPAGGTGHISMHANSFIPPWDGAIRTQTRAGAGRTVIPPQERKWIQWVCEKRKQLCFLPRSPVLTNCCEVHAKLLRRILAGSFLRHRLDGE